MTEARRAFPWLAAGPSVVQQQALRDFDQALRNWHAGTHERPTWRKARHHEGFRIVDGEGIKVEQINRRWSRARIPRVGWVKFRRTRPIPASARSFRVGRDAAGRWHIAFAVKPEPISAPENGQVIGVDRGVTVTLAYSDGTLLNAPTPAPTRRAHQALSRCKRGSNRRGEARRRLARLHRHNTDRRRDFIEKSTTDLARRFDLIRIEDLRVSCMTRTARGTAAQPGRNVRQKAGLNRAILDGGWGLFAARLQDKAPQRVEKVNPAYTSQTCAACGIVDARNRENQAFRCVGCGYEAHADVNAAQVIAAGRAARGVEKSSALKRRPQPAAMGRGAGLSAATGGDGRQWDHLKASSSLLEQRRNERDAG